MLSSGLLRHLSPRLPPHLVRSAHLWLPLLVLVVHRLELADLLDRFFICDGMNLLGILRTDKLSKLPHLLLESLDLLLLRIDFLSLLHLAS